MKLFLNVMLIFFIFGRAQSAGLRQQKPRGSLDSRTSTSLRGLLELDHESLSLNDEFAPSASPTLALTDSPTFAPTDSPTTSFPSPLPTAATTATPTSPDNQETADVTFSGGDAAGESFTLDVVLDDNFQQTVWHVFKGVGDSKTDIYIVNFGDLTRGGLHRTKFVDMPPGSYTFAIVDIGNDGIRGGGVTIYREDGSLIYQNDGNFGFLAEWVFIL